MASAQSSQDTWHGRGHQPQQFGNAHPRHRSESSRLSDRRRPVMTVARERDHFPGALHEGDPVRVFSRSADKWVDGEVVKSFEGNFVRVEYWVGEYWCGKMLHLRSGHLVIPTGVVDPSSDQHNSGAPSASIVTAPFRAKASARRSRDRQLHEEWNPLALCSDSKSPRCPRGEPASDPRWLLSCKYDAHRQISTNAALVEKMLGADVVSNPNRFSKTCCTIVGDQWDDNYNKGDNAEKYLRCWNPHAPQELRCTKPVASGQEPTTATCWKSSYFWRLQKSRKMLRLVEGNLLGEGQQIEKAMAEFLQSEPGGCEVREIECANFDFKIETGACEEFSTEAIFDQKDCENFYEARHLLCMGERLLEAGFTLDPEERCPYIQFWFGTPKCTILCDA